MSLLFQKEVRENEKNAITKKIAHIISMINESIKHKVDLGIQDCDVYYYTSESIKDDFYKIEERFLNEIEIDKKSYFKNVELIYDRLKKLTDESDINAKINYEYEGIYLMNKACLPVIMVLHKLRDGNYIKNLADFIYHESEVKVSYEIGRVPCDGNGNDAPPEIFKFFKHTLYKAAWAIKNN